MLRILALPVTLLATAMVALAGEDPLPGDEPDSFDIEPPLLKQNLSDEPLPGEAGPNADVSRLEKQLERVKRNAAGAERLCKMGVLSKIEVEQRLLKVVRCECDLENVRLVRAKEEVAAQAAAAKRERAELETAETNLRRQEKLLKLGSAHKSDVDRAQQKLAELKAQKN